MQLIVLCFLPRSTCLPSSCICCNWQTLAVTKCAEGFVQHFVDWNTLVMTTLVVKFRALRWLCIHEYFQTVVFGSSVAGQNHKQVLLVCPPRTLDIPGKPSFMWPLSYSFKNEWLSCMSFTKTPGPGNFIEVGVCPNSGIILSESGCYGMNRTETEPEVTYWPTAQTHQICSADVFIGIIWCFFFNLN